MSTEMVMPKMGESITEGTILKWLKGVGDKVEKDEIILEISTDKVDSEIPSPVEGILEKIVVPEGETVDVGTVIAQIGSGENIQASAPAEPAKKEEPAKPEEPKVEAKPIEKEKPESALEAAPASQPPIESAKQRGAGFYSPLVKSIAEQENISQAELERISGTGKDGRVTKNDVMAFLNNRGTRAAAPVMPVASKAPVSSGSMPPMPTAEGPKYAGETQIIEMDNMRKAIADHMVKSVHTSPHVYSMSEADVSHLVAYREAVKDTFYSQEGFKLTYQPFFMFAAAKALRDFPQINASVEGTKIILKGEMNLGMAVALPSGLIVPNVKNAQTLNLLGMARACNDLGHRARTKKLLPDDVQGGTFSVTNLGSFGNLYGTPIISQPQVAILAVGVIKKRVVVVNDAIAIRDMVYLCLGYDHRIIDGALGGQFLERVVYYLQEMKPDQI